MNKIRHSLYTVGILLITAFIILSGWYGSTVYSQASTWTGSKYNPRKNSGSTVRSLGDIYDRYGVVLASTDKKGNRVYHEDEQLRRAVSQTVGDQLSMSGTGVETFHSDILTGYTGSLTDRILAMFSGNSYSGDNITLTIDANLCYYISRSFPDGYNGAVCVINYKTGEILALVSKEDYDPQALIDTKLYSTEGSAYFNRCLQGQYTPGSTFKIITLAAALENEKDFENRIYTCNASEDFGTATVTCQSGRLAHGSNNLLGAFKKSCNVAFATVSTELGNQALKAAAEAFGFNQSFHFEDISLFQSRMENTTSAGELAWTGVGQGQTTVTPLHMAMIAGSVANKGIMMEPKLIQKVTSSGGFVKANLIKEEFLRTMSAETASRILKYMYYTVESGTASRAGIDGYVVCGKTGSAETTGNKDIATTSWYVGFVYDDAHPFAISVVVEEGGSGSSLAAPLASSILSKAISITDAKKQ